MLSHPPPSSAGVFLTFHAGMRWGRAQRGAVRRRELLLGFSSLSICFLFLFALIMPAPLLRSACIRFRSAACTCAVAVLLCGRLIVRCG